MIQSSSSHHQLPTTEVFAGAGAAGKGRALQGHLICVWQKWDIAT